jgi:hypothetical protein
VWSGEHWVPPSEASIQARAGLIGRARESGPLTEILRQVLPRADRYLVKVTWHGYAQGTCTGPAALDLLLGALPGPAVEAALGSITLENRLTDGISTLSEGLVGADLLASRLQGQDVRRSVFYDVVRDRLGWSEVAAEIALPAALQASLV